MRAVGRWFLLIAALATCLVVGYGAYQLAGRSWDAVVSYESPYAALDLPPSRGSRGVAERTVLVIIDGLRLDTSREMVTLNALRSYGMDLELTAPQPSLSYPNWTTILSGAPPYVSGVVTNWHEGQAQAETLFDTAKRDGADTVFVGPDDFETLFGVKATTRATYMKKWDSRYLSGEYVDAALRLAEDPDTRLLVLHLPDIDEAGHDFGGESEEYERAVAQVDADMRRLVEGLQDEKTLFVVVSDHGHISGGGHGGWEDEVVKVPGVFSGPGVRLGSGAGRTEDVAPTIAVMAGLPLPRLASGVPLDAVLGDAKLDGRATANAARIRFEEAYVRTVVGPLGKRTEAQLLEQIAERPEPGTAMVAADRLRLAHDRRERLQLSALGAVASLAVLLVVGVFSIKALEAALAGMLAYYGFYNLLFFGVHRYAWSLSAFNSEDRISGWMNLRLAEAALSGIVAVAVAAAVYPLLRSAPKGPAGRYLAGWLSLGPVTILVTLATLGLQVAWFVWAWGIVPEWRLPDLMWGFKYDLDLIQATALGFVALVTPGVTFLVGRYHPRIGTTAKEE